LDPAPLRIAFQSRNPISGTFFDLWRQAGRCQASDQRGVGSAAAEVAIDPTVPSQLTRAGAITGGGIHVIVLGGEKRKADSQLPHLRGALNAPGLLFGGAEGWEQHRGQDGDDGDEYQ